MEPQRTCFLSNHLVLGDEIHSFLPKPQDSGSKGAYSFSSFIWKPCVPLLIINLAISVGRSGFHHPGQGGCLGNMCAAVPFMLLVYVMCKNSLGYLRVRFGADLARAVCPRRRFVASVLAVARTQVQQSSACTYIYYNDPLTSMEDMLENEKGICIARSDEDTRDGNKQWK